ncbi:MAG: UDP-glucose--hexose-1-phosphate uridylyltransferase [Lachnospiraceae bacterium]|nr:UDP-glucose--hexose-1-phosphate uridylyltransferase [Lachnospiraceae bacterium]
MCRVDEPLPFVIDELLAYALDRQLIETEDVYYVRNGLMDLLGVKSPWKMGEKGLPCAEAFAMARKEAPGITPEPILKKILDYMVDHGMLEGEDVTYRDLMDARIMGYVTARPSEVDRRFFTLLKEDPRKASEYFYALSRANHYVMAERIEKNLYWTSPSPYGDLEITINLSKPEKDPKVIAKLLTMKSSDYPKCLLCPENVGYQGRPDHAARQNLRQIPMTLAGEQWYLQYSPYTYYQEHCILLKGEHVPMKINETTFRRLFEFIETLPHYFMGSNAGLPVVGGSILNHEHYQGGHHQFPMAKAACRAYYTDPRHKDVKIGAINWAMAGIRLSGKDKEQVIDTACHILHSWEAYSDASAGIFAFTDNVPHNAITPIARFNSLGEYELDLVLRNNLATEEYPDGVFHPHKELHHIKKENIGLIEVMGLAVLPGRLQKELAIIEELLLGANADDILPEDLAAIKKHSDWIREMKTAYGVVSSREEATEILKKEVGSIFARVLEDAGVYKNTAEGHAAFERFMTAAGFARI